MKIVENKNSEGTVVEIKIEGKSYPVYYDATADSTRIDYVKIPVKELKELINDN